MARDNVIEAAAIQALQRDLEIKKKWADLCPKLVEALGAAREELRVFEDDAYCDHDANICWCGFWHVVGEIDRVLAKAKEIEGNG